MKSHKDDKEIIIESGKGKIREPNANLFKPKPIRPKITINVPIHRSPTIFFPLEKLTTVGFIKVETNFKAGK